MTKESVDSVKNALSIGENKYNDYVSTRIIKCEVPIYEKIKKNNLSLFHKKNKVSTSKDKMKAVSLKEERNLMWMKYLNTNITTMPPLFRNMELSGKLASQISWIVFETMVHQR